MLSVVVAAVMIVYVRMEARRVLMDCAVRTALIRVFALMEVCRVLMESVKVDAVCVRAARLSPRWLTRPVAL